MSIEQTLIQRSNNQCELCGATDDLRIYQVLPNDGSAEQSMYICGTCENQIENLQTLDADHWRCLNDSMWSTTPAVQVMSYRLLQALGNQELLDMMYLESDVKAWADSVEISANSTDDEGVTVHRDSNGTILKEGDTVTLIKDLDVKGAGFTAKRGTIVKNIHLTDDAKFIEGKINGTQIVLVAAYMKKSL
ncbi:MAG TPA: PhnA domain-containing protein [Sulfuricurvum sp.]|nr:MAG: PhnA domain protein [Campylobacterales bacterium 16-40-21]OZA03799.1 MAG: PhnA domain protein [Sulfuricurvum sp. 17-40-25]HQS65683.1 PhnA domain-containing protein [Sulfuricurvum sp.]HQT37340.1 PhnA domain-containing protein [Sulfuricurvum sp.]